MIRGPGSAARRDRCRTWASHSSCVSATARASARIWWWDGSVEGRIIADHETVLEAVSAALSDVMTRDQVLLALQAHELALVHHFGVYLEDRLQSQL